MAKSTRERTRRSETPAHRSAGIDAPDRQGAAYEAALGDIARAAVTPETVNSGDIVRLQRRLGNRRLGSLLTTHSERAIRRAPLTAEEREQNLTHSPYAGNERLEQAYDNSPALRSGASGDPVRLVQQGLLDDGILLPASTENGTAPPDGKFGPETRRGVREFQDRHDIAVDGVVGRQTLGALDELAGTHTTPPGGEVGPDEPVPDIPPLSTPEFIIDVLQRADTDMLNALRADTAFLDGIQSLMSPAEFGRAAACFCLIVPAGVQHPAESKTEALRILSAQMAGDKATTRRTIERVRGLVIPANRLTTDYPPFNTLSGTSTADGRTWDTVRGIGNTPLGALTYSSLPEDNLLGIPCTATYTPTSGPNAGVPQAIGQSPEGFSVATHEFAHAMHGASLTDDDRETIQDAYDTRKTAAAADPTNPDMWVDGREGCYASTSVMEFYAQLSNAYLGTNTGIDFATSDARHNGWIWVLAHEPEVYEILDRIYDNSELAGTNPISAPLAGGGAAPTPAGGTP
ncbi:MAG: peptidoglycan-binding domain-containing protein [Anaerolineae bacterium]